MKIVIAASVKSHGGVWRHIVDLAQALRTSGDSVELLLPDDASSLREEATNAALKVISWCEVPSDAILHVHLANTLDRRLGMLIWRARLKRLAVIVTEHLPRTDATDPDLASRSPRPGAKVMKTALKRLQLWPVLRVIVLSERTRCFMKDRYGIRDESLVVVPNGIPLDEVAGAGRCDAATSHDGSTRFVAAGALIQQKGFDVLVEATTFGRERWHVDVYGDGPHKQRLVDAAAEPNSARRDRTVAFHGWSQDVATHMRRAACVVIPSRWEASSYTALEAMASSIPVIGTDVDGLGDIVVDGRTGRLVPAGDARALAQALDEMSTAEGTRARMGAAARDRLVREYSLATMVLSTRAVYARAQPEGLSGPSEEAA